MSEQRAQKRHCSRDSISSLTDKEAKEAAEILLSIKDSVQKSKFSTYLEFERIAAIADEAMGSFETFQEYCKRFEGADCKILTLSGVSEGDRPRLGFQQTQVDITTHPRLLFPLPAQWDIVHMLSTINMLRRFIGIVIEAGCRIIIDFILIYMISHLGKNETMFVLPELILSKGGKNGRMAYVHTTDGTDEYITGLVGFTDYAVHYLPTSYEQLKAEHPPSIETGYRVLEALGDASTPDSVVLLVEAKNVELVLEDNLPQAIAECLAALTIFQQDDRPEIRKRIDQTFVLTNGFRWIFGVVRQHGYECNSGERICYHSGVIAFDEVSGINPTQFTLVLRMLQLWIKSSAGVIFNIFESALKESDSNNE
ncbi:hypothetical protein BDN72DRAFT_341116 [Pluteus cervinus]|uniref:Uncharacterized protein n=1 Tax=Pluteus cervinus TaxID=181527 RepID=A0ACD3ABP6_9AGAR|nr:hypothetical protein BDN72DRAFT_341116 [Pluteus cervinus]